MSTQLSTPSTGLVPLDPHHHGGGGGGHQLVAGVGGAAPPPPPASSPFNHKQRLVPTMVVKTERSDDDGVDLSFDSNPGLKKENFEMKPSATTTPTADVKDVKVKFEPPSTASHPASHHPPSQSRGGGLDQLGRGGTNDGGRLKIYKDGRVLLELTHRCASDGEKVNWVPTGSKKVYWPPGPPTAAAAPLSARLDSNASTNTITGSDGSGETGSYSSAPPMSPWGTTPSPRPTPWHPAPPHRVKPLPRKWSSSAAEDLLFAMKPPQGVRNYRKKLRNLRRKCRQPGAEVKIGIFVLRMELQSAAQRPPPPRRAPPAVSPAARGGRLEALLASIVTRKSMIHVPISAWRPGRTDLQNLVKNPPSNPGSPQPPPRSPVRYHHPASPVGAKYPASPGGGSGGLKYPGSPGGGGGLKYPGSPGGGLRVKSELKMITETCTSTITSVSASPARHHTPKVKAETRTVVAETRSVPVRSLPITPTVARVKSEPDGGGGGASRLKASAITALMSPEMARVRMEIGPAGGLEREPGFREQGFISPRKRYLREYENGGSGPAAVGGPSPAKSRRMSTEHRLSAEHRLSTDSLGSTGDRSSPYRGGPASPRPLPAAAAAAKPFSAFSIDSLISGPSAVGGGGSPAASPSRAGPLASTRRDSAGQHHRDRSGSPSHPRRPSSHLPVAPTPTRPSPTPTKSPPPPSAALAAAAAAAAAAGQPPQPFPGYPFMYPGAAAAHPLLAQHPLFDPRLAHLAALSQAASMSQAAAAAAAAAAANGGAPAPYPFSLYPQFNPYLAGSSPYTPTPSAAVGAAPPPPSVAATPMVWTPPVGSGSGATPTPPNSNSSQRDETPTPTNSLTSPTYHPPNTSTSHPAPPTSVFAPTPTKPPMASLNAPRPVSAPRPTRPPSQEKIQDAHRQPETIQYMETQSGTSDDAPLNLSMKPSSMKPTML